MNRILRHLIFIALLLVTATAALAQGGDSPYVIKIKGSNHYLAHVKVGDIWVLQDATTFGPECIWYSGIEQNITGTAHNYYFIDDNENMRFLTAPLQGDGTLGLSGTLPPTYQLSNTDLEYYFYDWDQDNGTDGGGVARGHQHTGIDTEGECTANGSSWDNYDKQCWEVYWVSFKEGSGWKLTSESHYSINDIPESEGKGGKFHKMTVIDYLTTVSGGLSTLTLSNSEMSHNTSQSLSASVALPYTYKSYTLYHFVENIGTKAEPNLVPHDHYYYGGGDHNSQPASANGTVNSVTTYKWTLSGPGAQYLSFASDSKVSSSENTSPTLYYRDENMTGDKEATLTLKVTYSNGLTQEQTATVIVKTSCQNPVQAATPIVYYKDVTVSWYNIAQRYRLYWKSGGDADWNRVTVNSTAEEVITYTLTDLAENTEYQYKVQAQCGESWQSDPVNVYSFTTGQAADLIIHGSVFGGGRMANVTGYTEVIIVNCDSIGAVYGGNDIAGDVQGSGGSTIVLGVNASDANANAYNDGAASVKVRVNNVYGGGNGYYAYNGTSFEAASDSYGSQEVAVNGSVNAMTKLHAVGQAVWTNKGVAAETLHFPSIIKTAITVVNNTVKVDSVFGGAKNAFITNSVPDANGTSVTINGGTIYSVFGGNNWGGTQTAGKHYVKVNGTTTKATVSDYNNNRLGHDFGICHLFGGGNKVAGKNTDVTIVGGQCDTVFAGGNAADVASASVAVNCNIASGSGNTFGNTYSDAIESYSAGITVKDNYPWNCTGIYNVRVLFGGNNKAAMAVVPNITLTSGSVGIVYGGGNAGDMNGEVTTSDIATDFGALVVNSEPQNIYHSTHVVLNSANMLVDYLYGGCQMSDVYHSTWVEMRDGHVGTLYGGCNISGDVGSRYLFSDGWNFRPRNERYQAVQGATYVKVSGGHIYGDLFAGSNGRYHCNNGREYIAGVNFDRIDKEGRYIGMPVPSHNETHVYVSGGEVGGSVYAGGNLACVGFINESVPAKFYTPVFVGFATVRMTGGRVRGNVFGGGNMASIWGSNSVMIEGGKIDGALYGGNDRIGLVAQITNRVLPSSYGKASDNLTSLADVRTYISLTGRPDVNTVYGGGNGDYDYSDGDYCNPNDQPVQSNTFVDINIDGFEDPSTHVAGGHIGTVYGGGNGVTVTGTTTVFLNVKGNGAAEPEAYDHVGTIFGGNNKGPLAILPDIIMLKGRVNTVYGGCNQGAMVGSFTREINGVTYNNLGSIVRLRSSYDGDGVGGESPITPTASVTGAAYGGCRLNGVDNNTLVIVEGGTHEAKFFGGSDISGTIGGISQVVVTGGQTGNIYGGGNGNYDYDGHYVYIVGSDHNNAANLVASSNVDITAPHCAVSKVNISGGQVGASGDGNDRDVYGGGWGSGTSTSGDVSVTIGPATATSWENLPVIYGNIYGGSAYGSVNTNYSNTTIVDFLNGTLHGDLFGGGLGEAGNPDKGKTYGQVFVNISNNTEDSCYIDLRNANIFGCNNTNGSPQDNVTVNVYKTAYNYSDYASGDKYKSSYIAPNEETPCYAIRQVFGGGNKANYAPEDGSSSSEKNTTVNIYNCNNTIGRVFGGGNAADAHAVESNIYGGRFHQVFGGGNGDPTAANIGAGGATINVYGGNILQLFGGNNKLGEVTGPLSVNVTNSPECYENITEFFGGSNQASMGSSTPVDLVTTIDCSTPPVTIDNVYGGSNLASITGNVTLVIKGGVYSDVYAGSKGEVGTAANINGTTTLNLYGGTITDAAYGGNNVNGNITGQITVNVLDHEACPLNVNDVYGASNATNYEPTDPTQVSPIVNVIHVSKAEGIRGSVYGGGNLASVTANPQVNIGYDASTMPSSLIPEGYSIDEANRRAYVSGKVFGGGNAAGVTGSPVINMRNGTVLTGLYGGCNSSGTVTGSTTISFTGGTMGAAAVGTSGEPGYVAQRNANIYGGGLGADTKVKGNVAVTIDAPSGTIYGDVYGGSAKGLVNCNDDGDARNGESKTDVILNAGTIYGDLYGGGHGLESSAANVWGPVTVTVNGGAVDNVFGCNNLNGQPKGTVKVDINETVANSMFVNNVYGGGNEAYFEGTPEVKIQNGTVTNNVFGGGNNIAMENKGVTGGNVLMSGGTVLGGIYGGCNTNGDVTGNVTVYITGGTIGAVGAGNEAYIHGGGYGQNTTVAGNVAVTFGNINAEQGEYPRLYGELYGGSALGSVNTNANNNTTVNIYNGTIEGSVFGGGLGEAGVAATVNGKVQVNIGTLNGSDLLGKATLNKCDVYGCNNVNGSPQDEVNVNVFNTYRRSIDEVDYNAVDFGFAIRNVFGGGNRADYYPSTVEMKTHVYVYGCDNTAEFLYAGGNAAAARGVEIVVEGGRFREAYGGGNGLLTPADIGDGGIGFNFYGHYNYTFGGSNKTGSNSGGIMDPPPSFKAGRSACGENFIESHFFGANEAESYVDVLENTISCEEAGSYVFTNVYAGSRWAIIYGDVKLTVEGGTIMNLFGGSQGYEDYSADIRRYPTKSEIEVDYALPEGQRKYSNSLLVHMGYLTESGNVYTVNDSYEDPAYAGHGGNITLVVRGGTIGSVIGGSDVNGKVEGQITVIIDEAGGDCELNLGNVYGGCNYALYAPRETTNPTPKVEVLKGTLGMQYDFNRNGNIDESERFAGNVFGGGNFGKVIGNPRVIIGDGTTGLSATKVTINGDVYGGGNEGDVQGSPEVIIVPENPHTLGIQAPTNGTIELPHTTLSEGVEVEIKAIPDECYVFESWTLVSGTEATIINSSLASSIFKMGTTDATITASFGAASSNTLTVSTSNGTVSVKDRHNVDVTSGSPVCVGKVLNIEATPDANYVFKKWNCTGAGSRVSIPTAASTIFTMGTETSELTATFVPVRTLTLDAYPSDGGTFMVNGVPYTSPIEVVVGENVNIEAISVEGKNFSMWSVSTTGTGESLTSTTSSSTTFTMGSENATITATFVNK